MRESVVDECMAAARAEMSEQKLPTGRDPEPVWCGTAEMWLRPMSLLGRTAYFNWSDHNPGARHLGGELVRRCVCDEAGSLLLYDEPPALIEMAMGPDMLRAAVRCIVALNAAGVPPPG